MTNCTRNALLLYSALTLATAGLCSLVFINGPASGDRSRYRRVAAPQVATASAMVTRSTEEQRIVEAYGRLPLSFEANRGQTSAAVQFQARGAGYSLFLNPEEMVLALRQPDRSETSCSAGLQACIATDHETTVGGVVRMRLLGGRRDALMEGRDELPGRVNYFLGNDPTEWRTDIPTYAKVAQENVYPGIDLVYYGNQQQLEYDFVISPGADPRAIRLGFDGAERLEVDTQGDLVVHLAEGALRQRKPIVYQEIDSVRREVAGSYLLADAGVTFELGAYDRARPLVIDPVLVYSTFLGGTAMDQGLGIAVDVFGNAYVTGITSSGLGFPPDPANAYPTTPGADDTTFGAPTDAVVTKLNAAGTALIYSTYLGGSGLDLGRSIAVDADGQAHVTGETRSRNFPTTPGASDGTLNGLSDAFVTTLNADGDDLVGSTYLGGGGIDSGHGIAFDGNGALYVTGQAGFSGPPVFPTTPGAADTTFGVFSFQPEAFVTKLNGAGGVLLYSTYLGGNGTETGRSIAVDAAGNAYVVGDTSSPSIPPANAFPTTPNAFDTTSNGGTDAFVTKVNATGTAFVYSTYLGGGGNDVAFGMAVDAVGDVYVTGQTNSGVGASTPFPTTPDAFDTAFNGGANDAFVTKLIPAANAGLEYSSYLGGGGDDRAFGIAVNGSGEAYVVGQTNSGIGVTAPFPTTPNALDSTFNGGTGTGDAFVTGLAADFSALVYSTYLGGSSNDVGSAIIIDAADNVYVTGQTASGGTPPSAFPTTLGAYDTTFNNVSDAFVAKFGVSVDKTTLWPPNHKMVDIAVSYGVVAGTSCALTVSSNEPENGTGDGDTDVDWEIVDANHVRLRSERSGNGSGRVYTITITCTDSLGASSTQTVTVTVPKSQGNK